MNWTTISEGIISTIIGTLVATSITFIFKSIFYKENKTESLQNKTKIPFFKDLFLISLFITSFTFVITLFSFIYNWTFNVYLILASFGLSLITSWTYTNQCPNCRSVFHAKTIINKETLREEKRPYHYKDETIYLYTDGTIKDRIFHGPEKTKMETWRVEKEYYSCQSCHYNWNKIFEKNLDFNNRPKATIKRTHYRNPNEFSI